MARYLVGRRGFLKPAWEFPQAIAAAGDGDVIELEAGYSPFYEQNGQSITISKNITIEGHPVQNEASGRFLLNVIDAVFVKDGAAVILKDLEIRKDTDKHNNINVSGASTLVMENVVLTSWASSGENYPVIHVTGKSQVTLRGSMVAPANLHDRNYKVYVNDAALQVFSSTINTCIWMMDSKLELQNSLIRYTEANALFAKGNSVVTAANTTFEGGARNGKKWWSCVKLVDSQLTASNVVVKQPDYNQALCMVNTKAALDIGRYDSLYLTGSEASVGNIGVVESVAIDSGSHVKAKGIGIVGKDNGRVNLYVGRESSLEAGMVCFGRLSKPNTKVERHSAFRVEEMVQAAYDPESWEFVFDGTGSLTQMTDASEIEYFGKLTAFERLNQMVGIRSAKQAVEEFIAVAEMNKKREKQGLKNPAFSLHSLFLGNPGTGKTTVARLVGEILYEKNIISSQKFVETSRSDLVGRYIGETALKTREVLESALGGVLFIDEAYTLWAGEDNSKDFGIEAINEILKFMEDHRQDIVLIFAGYTHSMERFLESNEGLKSRIPNTFIFEDYTEEELVRIGLGDLHDLKYEIDERAYAALVHKKNAESNDKSNGRWVRNLNEKLIRKMAVRASQNPGVNLALITKEDMDAM